MPEAEFNHPPPAKPVDGEDLQSLRIHISMFKFQKQVMQNGSPDPIPTDFRPAFAAAMGPIINKMLCVGLERRWALYDSHSTEELTSGSIPEGDLEYFYGDVIEVLQNTNEDWSLGLCRGRFGFFPISHSTTGPFVLALNDYHAANEQEISIRRGHVMPATAYSHSLYTVFRGVEYGDVAQQNLVGLDTLVPSEAENPEIHYQYSRLQPNQIRLASVRASDAAAFEACGKQSLFLTIFHAPLENVKEAVALSYCWGDPNDKRPIFANGKLLYIPSTLWRALRRQYPSSGLDSFGLPGGAEDDPKGPAIFWADAICINQNDILEKNHQIPLMGSIYSRAKQVLVYVNESVESVVSMTVMKVIAQAAEPYEPWTIVPHDVIRKEMSTMKWDDVRDFFSEPVFRRSWVIQEIALATNITICYGMVRLKLPEMVRCIDAIRKNHVRDVDSLLGFPWWTRGQSLQFAAGTRQLLNLISIKQRRGLQDASNFIEILQNFRQSKATDPRDKVYSLLSLAPRSYQEQLSPDYSEQNTVLDVYKKLAIVAFHSDDLEYLLLNACSRQNIPGLPSWVPDWSIELRTALISMKFNSCGKETRIRASISNSSANQLTVRGIVFDQIAQTSPELNYAEHEQLPDTFGTLTVLIMLVGHLFINAGLAKDGLAASEHQGRYPSGDDPVTAAWNALVCGHGWSGERVRPSEQNHFDAFLRCYQKELLDLFEANGSQMYLHNGSNGTKILRTQADINSSF